MDFDNQDIELVLSMEGSFRRKWHVLILQLPREQEGQFLYAVTVQKAPENKPPRTKTPDDKIPRTNPHDNKSPRTNVPRQ